MYHLPPEWAPQSAVMLTWPHGHGDWAPLLAEVEPVFLAIAREVSRRQRLLVSGFDAAHCTQIKTSMERAGIDLAQTEIFAVPSNDTWVRDHGPITVYDGERPRLLDFTFNGWGGKYAAELDNRLSAELHALGAFGNTPMERVDLVLEGGSIESDGQGTLLTTAHCLLNPSRNPGLDAEALTVRFARLFGIQRVLWLEHGQLEGDDTDGHIDTLARFCDAHTIAYVSCDDPADSHYAELQAMRGELEGLRDSDGAPYRLVPLPLPAARYDAEGQRLPATYANFLIINGAVLVPTYRDLLDETALARLRECFPGREVVGIDCLPLIHQYGSLHCVSMQLPAGVLT